MPKRYRRRLDMVLTTGVGTNGDAVHRQPGARAQTERAAWADDGCHEPRKE